MDKVFHAIELAARAHRGQVRKGSGVPYLVHPLNVAKILIQQGCEEDLVVAGLLHDTVEDTELELADIEAEFGHRVAALVAGASEPDRTASWEERKQHTIDHIRVAPEDVLWIVCADKLDNVRSLREDLERIGAELWTRFNRPKPAQAWYYRSLVAALGKRIEGALFEQLEAEIGALFTEEGD
jgi:(p)ppGpp synthase/HD superfamily hydrolase